MSRIRAVAAKLVALARRSRIERDLDDEMRDRLERAVADNVARGMDPVRARSAAHAAFGSAAYVRQLHAETAGFPVVEDAWRDARHAVRAYLKAPLFAAAIVVTLSFGVGATAAIFAMVDAVVLRPLPFPASGRLVAVGGAERGTGRHSSISPPDYFDLVERSRGFAAMGAYWSSTVAMAAPGGPPSRVLVTLGTANLLSTLGVSPALGRAFAQDDAAIGAPRVAMVSDGLWRRGFGGDPALVGRDILVDDAPTTVVGVLPPGFAFPVTGADLWIPLRLSATQPQNPAIPVNRYRQYRILSVVGRLGAGATLSRAQADLSSIADALSREHPQTNARATFTAVTLHESVVGDVRPAMFLLLGAVACLLLIATANVAILMTVRAASREADLTLQLALGAGRGRVARQMLIESVLLALAGGVAGLAGAIVFLRILIGFAPPGIPRIESAQVDATVIAFTFLVAATAGVLCGLAPALQVGRRALVDALKGRATGRPGPQRLRRTLIVAEVALSMLLLATAGLLTQTFVHLGRVELGFAPNGVAVVDRLDLGRLTPPESSAFYRDLLGRVRAIPGVDEAGFTLGVPLDPRGRFYVDETPLAIDGHPAATTSDRPSARIHVVSDRYFAAAGIPLTGGRDFDEADRADASGVAIVNRALARRYFAGEDPVGRYVTHELSIVPGQPTRRRIVGVVGDVRQFGLDEPFEPQLFVPHAQMPWPSMALVVKSALPAERLAGSVRSAVEALDPRMPVPPAVDMNRMLDAALGQPRLRAWLVGVFATTAMLLAVIGLYGTIAFVVQQRRNELAIRLVLGATAMTIGRAVMRDGLTLALAGISIGSLAAFVLTRSLSTLLFGVSAFDPATIAGVAVLLFTVAGVACYLPARRVAHIDLLASIRQ